MLEPVTIERGKTMGKGGAKDKTSISFTDNPRCLLRIATARSPRAVTLADGTRLEAGDPVVGAHLWNAHLPGERAGLASILAQMGESLRELAHHLQAQPDLGDARALYGELGFFPEERLPLAQQLMARLGFELVPRERPGWNPFRRAFWRNVQSWRLLRRFNPAQLDAVGFGRMRRCEAWMSREQLLARYGA